jgi:RNA polymerase sigma-70 factor (ECF subfamily)
MLHVTVSRAPWQDVAAQLRPFLAHRVDASEIDDVLHDVWLRVQRGLPGLRDEDRFTSWLFQIARSAVAEHQRTRARYPLVDAPPDSESAAEPAHDDREEARSLARCISIFVALLPSPYREAVTLVELQRLTAREAAEIVGISVSGMKSRVQRGRAQLRQLFEACCEIALDARGKVIDYTPRSGSCRTCAPRADLDIARRVPARPDEHRLVRHPAIGHSGNRAQEAQGSGHADDP